MAVPSDLFSFDNVADDDAKIRRAQVTNDTEYKPPQQAPEVFGPISKFMMENNPRTGFMPGIEGEGLSPDPFAKTYYEGEKIAPPTNRAVDDLFIDEHRAAVAGKRRDSGMMDMLNNRLNPMPWKWL